MNIMALISPGNSSTRKRWCRSFIHWAAFLCVWLFSLSIMAQVNVPSGASIPESVHKAIAAFLIDAEHYTRIPSEKKEIFKKDVFTKNNHGGVGRGHLPNNKQKIIEHLRHYVLSASYLLSTYPENKRQKDWYIDKNWEKDVLPFFENNSVPFDYASDLVKIGYALRFMTLILGTEQEVVESFTEIDLRQAFVDLNNRYGPIQLPLSYATISSELLISDQLDPASRRLFDDHIKRFMTPQIGRLQEYSGLEAGPYWYFMSHNISHVPFDLPDDCTTPEVETIGRALTQNEIALAQFRLSETLKNRSVRSQIGDTCYANLAAELVDIHRLTKIYRDRNLHDKQAIKSVVDGAKYDTSAFYAAAMYTLRSEGDTRNFDYGFSTKTIELLLSTGGCPVSPWELRNGPNSSKEYEKLFSLIEFLRNPGSNSDTVQHLEMLDTFLGLLAMESPNTITQEIYEEFKRDPVVFLRSNSFDTEWVTTLLEKTAYISTCGYELIRSSNVTNMYELDDSFSTSGPLIEYPGGKVETFFGRNYRDSYDYSSMITSLKSRINSGSFQGIGVAVCNNGIAKSITTQHIIDLDRPRGSHGAVKMLSGYKFKFKDDKYGSITSDQCGGHTYLLSSMRYNSDLKQCEYKLRNSWGEAATYPWHYTGTSWLAPTTDNKDLWVPSHLLYRNLTGLSAIVPSEN